MTRYFLRQLVVFSFLVFTHSSFAAIEVHDFANDVERQRYQSFIDELRCPKCQNQNLSGSDSPIAADLRHELYDMIKSGRSDQEIVDFMVKRYGEFILYRPRLTPTTIFLWALPGVLLVSGALVLWMMVRRRRQSLVEQDLGLSTDEQARINALLSGEPETKQSNNPNSKKNKKGEQQ
jgi:cytochrome c-type biogenesis protein CcmH